MAPRTVATLPTDTPVAEAGPMPARRPVRVARRVIGASIDLGGLAILLTQAWRMG